MGDALLLGSTRVVPKKLMDADTEFCHPDLESALEENLR
jgi:NAD dependent epimerase/dehydratase family enzyme